MPDMIYRETGECDLPADFAAIPPALKRMELFFLARGLPAALWDGIELAAAEAANNAVQHGCRGRPDARVRLSWLWQGEWLRITLADPGRFDPGAKEPHLPHDIMTESGRGQFLMAQLMDEIRHENDASGHRVILSKRVGPAACLESAAAAAELTIQSMTEELSLTYENLAALLQFAESLATTPSFEAFTSSAIARLRNLVGAPDASFRFADAAGRLGPQHGSPQASAETANPPDGSAESEVFRRGKERTLENLATLRHDDPLRRDGGSAFVCPIFFHQEVIGVLCIAKPPGMPFFTAGELALTRTVADFLGIARTTALLERERQEQQRRIRDLEIASSIQQSLLPRNFPTNQCVRIFGICEPAQEIGGDFFDVLEPDGKGALLVIADVMGKGVPAALFASVFRTAIRSRLDLAQTPGRLLGEVNRQISADLADLDMFITAQVAFLRYEDGLLHLSNAGHCPVIQIQQRGSRVARLPVEGLPLGLLRDNPYQTATFPVEKDDRLIFLTDGLYEFPDAPASDPGLDGFIAQASAFHAVDGRAFCAGILDWARRIDGGRSARDDRTLLVVDRIA